MQQMWMASFSSSGSPDAVDHSDIFPLDWAVVLPCACSSSADFCSAPSDKQPGVPLFSLRFQASSVVFSNVSLATAAGGLVHYSLACFFFVRRSFTLVNKERWDCLDLKTTNMPKHLLHTVKNGVLSYLVSGVWYPPEVWHESCLRFRTVPLEAKSIKQVYVPFSVKSSEWHHR